MTDSSSPAAAFEPEWKRLWLINPGITFLNHGSFGACPIAVLEKQQELRHLLESEPLRFMEDQLESLLDAAREALANFVGAFPSELVFVPNATTGINTVLRSLSFQPGDELLTTNQEYNASRNALNFVAAQSGATVIVAEIPFPIASPNQVIDAVMAKISARTRLVLIDQVTSQTALILPIEALVQRLKPFGIEVLVDAAHAPGMIPLNLRELGVAYYTGNCHKWMCAPKGAAFLYVRQDQQSRIRPLVISHGANSPRLDRSRFHLEFDWMGTTDPTSYLCVSKAIDWMAALLPGGWAELMTRNQEMALAARAMLCDALNVAPPSPDCMIGSMAGVPLPPGSAKGLQMQLFDRFQIEVPIIPWQGVTDRLLRVSAQLYNSLPDYDYLSKALLVLLAEGA
jgi:isopenicillin-N epimerase